jgi:hypothetical protein
MDKRAGQSSRWLSIGIAPYLNNLGFHLLPKLNKHSFCMFYSLARAVNLGISPMYVQPNDPASNNNNIEYNCNGATDSKFLLWFI